MNVSVWDLFGSGMVDTAFFPKSFMDEKMKTPIGKSFVHLHIASKPLDKNWNSSRHITCILKIGREVWKHKIMPSLCPYHQSMTILLHQMGMAFYIFILQPQNPMNRGNTSKPRQTQIDILPETMNTKNSKKSAANTCGRYWNKFYCIFVGEPTSSGQVRL